MVPANDSYPDVLCPCSFGVGKMSFTEASQQGMTAEQFRLVDIDNDGFITPEECVFGGHQHDL